MLPGHWYVPSADEQRRRRLEQRPPVAFRVPPQEELDERRNLLAPIAKRRHADLDDLQPVVEILAELAGPDHRRQVAIGGRDDAHVDLHRPVAAELRERPILQHVQELGLEADGHLADFVEQDRAAARELELADARRLRARERPALVPEQLALEQLGRQRRAVDLDERLGPARGPPVQLARDHFLADAALAGEEHADVAVGDAVDHRQHVPHRGARAPAHLRAVRGLGDLRGQPCDLARERRVLERAVDRRLERRVVQRRRLVGLDDVVDRAEPHGVDDRRRAPAGRTA